MAGLNADGLRADLRKRFSAISMREWCRLSGCNASHLTDFLKGRRGPPSDVLEFLNLEVRYVKRRKEPSDGGY